MHIKRAYFAGEHDGEPLVQIVRPGEQIKTASFMMPSVQSFIDRLRPDPRYTYVLVNAMGYSEFYGPNSNRDWYGYNEHLDFNGLLHAPPDFGKNYEIDKMQGLSWPYGFPSYYGATVYAHHKNTDPQQLGFGDVIYVAPNPIMKRIELIERIFNEEAHKKGHTSILERIAAGERVDVSMGCFKAGAMVTMADGTKKPIEQIAVGDWVRTHTGGTGKVTELHRRMYRGKFIVLAGQNREVLWATEEHPFWAKPWGQPLYDWVFARDLQGCDLWDAENGKVVPLSQFSIEYDEADVYNFEVEGDNSYIVNGVAAHNCKVPFDFCLHPDTLVRTISGWHAAKEIEVGAQVLTHQGRYRKITKKFVRNVEDGLIQISSVGLPSIKVTATHPMYVVRKEQLHTCQEKRRRCSLKQDGVCVYCGNRPKIEPQWIDAGEVRLGDYLVAPVGKPERVPVDLPKARLLGYWIDGEQTKHLHEDVFSWNEQAILELLGGWIDTNGYFDISSGLVRIDSNLRSLALDVQRLLRLVGVPAMVTTSVANNAEVYQVSIQPEHVARLGLWRYSEKVKPFKKECVEDSSVFIVEDFVLHQVRKLEQIDYEGEVINFSVDEDESYIAEGVSTHNCSICTDWALVKKAWKTFDPDEHRHPGIAILHFHKKVQPIRGLAVTRNDYCEHMLNIPGKILPDGRKVFVYNDFPRFFDISFVLVGADRTARVMWYLGSTAPMGGTTMSPWAKRESSVVRLLEIVNKTSAINIASIDKEIPDGFVQEVKHDSDTAPDISETLTVVLDEAEDRKLMARKILTALAVLGIVPSPREFQTLALTHVPGGDLIKKALDEKGVVFDTSVGGIDDTFRVNEKFYDANLTQAFAMLMPERSSFDPFLTERLTSFESKTASAPAMPLRTELLDKLASQYNGYRISVLENAVDLFPKSAEFLGAQTVAKTSGKGIGLAALLLGLGPVISLLSSHLRSKREEGQHIGTMASFVADNPSFVALTTIGAGLRAAMAINKAGGLVQAVRSIVTAVRGSI
jgi:hypothetical protein